MAKNRHMTKDVLFILIGAAIILHSLGFIVLDGVVVGVIVGVILIVKGIYSLIEKK